MIWRIEARRLLRERLVVATMAILALVCSLAFASGRSVLTTQIDGRAALATDQIQERKGFVEQLQKAEAESVPTLPNGARFQAVAPTPALIDFSVGRAAFENYSTGVSLRVRQDGLFKRTQFDNAELLARGRLDLSIVVVVIAPLLLIALGYGLFASDRDSGVARLILAQAGTPTRLLLVRSVLRLALVSLPIVAAAGALLVLNPMADGRLYAAGVWLLVAGLGILTWWALILLVNSARLTSETSALLLVGIWGLLVFAVPAALAASADLAYPPPSRLELIATARATEVGASTDYENDHPGMSGEDAAAIQRSVLKSYRISRTVEGAVSPLIDAFERRQAQQAALVARLQYLSPPLVLSEALSRIAETDGARFLGFRQATRRYLADIKNSLGSLIERGQRMTLTDYEGLPTFSWRSASPRIGAALTYLILLTVGLLVAALVRYRRLVLA